MRLVLTGLGILAFAVLAASCSRKAVVESGPALDAADATARGTVRRLGSEGAVRTVLQGETTVVVLGDYEQEIGRIAGAEVWASGTAATSEYGEALVVSEYRITSVDGDVPIVGILEEDENGFYLREEDGDTVRLDVSERLAGALGAKVWVVLGADRVTVSRYGILRD
ncbi:MAG: hypothetical protein M8866_02595 [marine benthic group bacterium]|jgi:hypothetical protein|nr:hypothetical protein [Candidatus Benthicola marisminoris]